MTASAQNRLDAGSLNPERLPLWLWLVLPIVLAVVLFAVSRISAPFYETWFEHETTGVIQLIHWVIPLAGCLLALRILAMRTIGAGSPLRRSLRVFLQSSLVQPKYLPNRPDFSCMSAPHLSHSMTGPS